MSWQALIDRTYLSDDLRPERYNPEALAFEQYRRAQGDALIRLGSICAVRSGIHIQIPAESTAEGTPLLQASHVRALANKRTTIEQIVRVPRDQVDPRHIYRQGALLAVVFDTIQVLLDTSEIPGLDEFIPASTSLFVLQPKPGVSTAYLAEVLRTEVVETQLRSVAVGLIIRHVPARALEEIYVPRPDGPLGRDILSQLYWKRPAERERPEQANPLLDEVRLVAPVSPRDAVRNALALAASRDRMGILARRAGSGLFLQIERGEGDIATWRARIPELVVNGPENAELDQVIVGSGFDLSPYASELSEGKPILFNAIWGLPQVTDVTIARCEAREILGALSVLGMVEGSQNDVASEGERQQRTSVAAFLAYAEQAGLAGRIALAWTSSPESTDKLPTVDEVVRTLWDEDIAEWEDEESPSGKQHARIRQALAAAVRDAATFRQLVLACFAPFLLVGVATTGGEMIGVLAVPLAPDAELTNDLMWLVQELGNELRRQMRLYTQIQQEIASEIVGRISHIIRNRLGNLDGDLQTLANHIHSREWDNDLVKNEAVAAAAATRFGRSLQDYTVGGYVSRLQGHVEELRQVVKRMGQYYRGGIRQSVDIDLNQVINGQLKAWAAQRPDVKIAFHPDPAQPVVNMSVEDLHEILDNILSNSSHHLRAEDQPEGGHELRVTTQERREWVIVEIRNTGDSHLPPNPTETWVTTDAGHGTGLGLAIVARNMRKAGGTFKIVPNDDGPGVTNQLNLPNARWKREA